LPANSAKAVQRCCARRFLASQAMAAIREPADVCEGFSAKPSVYTEVRQELSAYLRS